MLFKRKDDVYTMVVRQLCHTIISIYYLSLDMIDMAQGQVIERNVSRKIVVQILTIDIYWKYLTF